MFNRDHPGGGLTRRPQEGLSRQDGNDWLWQRDPWREVQEMQRHMNNLFSRFFGMDWPVFSAPINQMAQAGVEEPDVDIYENNDEYIIRAALPGIQHNDIDVQATEDSIRLTAQSRSSFEPQQPGAAPANWQPGSTQDNMGQPDGQQQQTQPPGMQHRQSRYSRASRFEFASTLPEEIKPSKARANFRNGMLELHLPKAQPNSSQSRNVKVPIQAAESTQQLAGGASTPAAGSAASSQPVGVNTWEQHQPRAQSSDDMKPMQTNAQPSQPTGNTSSMAGKA